MTYTIKIKIIKKGILIFHRLINDL